MCSDRHDGSSGRRGGGPGEDGAAPGHALATKVGTEELAAELLARAGNEWVSLVGPGGLLSGLTKAVLEAALEGELTGHVGYQPHDPAGHHSGNSRNGTRTKTVITDVGPVEIDVPRDRAGTFEPVIVPKRARRLGGVDQMVLSLSAKGLTHGEISAHLEEIYGAKVSKETVTRITDNVIEGMVAWQNRPLDAVYPVVFIDAIVVKIREGQVANRPMYVAVGVTVDGERDILGLWAGDGGEGAKYWAHVLTEIKNRGIKDAGATHPERAAQHHRWPDPNALLQRAITLSSVAAKGGPLQASLAPAQQILEAQSVAFVRATAEAQAATARMTLAKANAAAATAAASRLRRPAGRHRPRDDDDHRAGHGRPWAYHDRCRREPADHNGAHPRVDHDLHHDRSARALSTARWATNPNRYNPAGWWFATRSAGSCSPDAPIVVSLTNQRPTQRTAARATAAWVCPRATIRATAAVSGGRMGRRLRGPSRPSVDRRGCTSGLWVPGPERRDARWRCPRSGRCRLAR